MGVCAQVGGKREALGTENRPEMDEQNLLGGMKKGMALVGAKMLRSAGGEGGGGPTREQTARAKPSCKTTHVVGKLKKPMRAACKQEWIWT